MVHKQIRIPKLTVICSQREGRRDCAEFRMRLANKFSAYAKFNQTLLILGKQSSIETSFLDGAFVAQDKKSKFDGEKPHATGLH